MKKILFMLIVAVVTILVGCKSTKTTSEQSSLLKESGKTEQNDNVKAESKSNVNLDTNVKDNSTNEVKKETKGSSETNIVNRKFSPPDEKGNQHVTEETTTNTKTSDSSNSEATQKNDIASNAKLEAENNAKLEADLKSKEELELKAKLEKEETEKNKPPIWIYVVGFCLGALLIFLIYLGLKRFGLVK